MTNRIEELTQEVEQLKDELKSMALHLAGTQGLELERESISELAYYAGYDTGVVLPDIANARLKAWLTFKISEGL